MCPLKYTRVSHRPKQKSKDTWNSWKTFESSEQPSESRRGRMSFMKSRVFLRWLLSFRRWWCLTPRTVSSKKNFITHAWVTTRVRVYEFFFCLTHRSGFERREIHKVWTFSESGRTYFPYARIHNNTARQALTTKCSRKCTCAFMIFFKKWL